MAHAFAISLRFEYVYLQPCYFFCVGMQICQIFYILLHLISNMQEYGVNRKNNLSTTINAVA